MTNRTTKIMVLISLFLLVTPGCSTSANILTPTVDKTPITATATQVALPTPPPPTPSPLPTPAPSEPIPDVPAEIMPVLESDFENLTLQRQAMRLDFADDVEVVARGGASRYYLEVSLDPDSFNNENGLNLSGVERIRYTNTEDVSLSEIYLHLYPNLPGYGGQMTVEKVVVNDQLVEPDLEADNSALRVSLAQPLLPGEIADLSLTYNAVIPRQTLFGYNIFVYEDNTVALAGFYPAIAVYDDQGWDTEVPPPYGDATYLDVSLYQVHLTVPEQMVVATSGSLVDRGSTVDRASNNGDTKTLSLVSGPMRDFYIVMRDDYQVSREIVDNVVVNSYYPPHLEAGGKLVLRYAADSLRVFNDRFGQYPYAEFDIVATPTTAGGVEYPGIVVINQEIYSYEGGFFQLTVSHEVAHQWWYGAVGNDQIDEPWLDESLTNYSTVLYWEEIEGVEAANEIVEAFFVGPYEEAKENGQDRAVVGPVEDFSEREYGIFVYGKGPLFFNALRQEVGDEIYFKIMRTYYSEYKYNIARGDDLLEVIERVSGQDVDPLFEKWMRKSE
jgi:hypothetical protein